MSGAPEQKRRQAAVTQTAAAYTARIAALEAERDAMQRRAEMAEDDMLSAGRACDGLATRVTELEAERDAARAEAEQLAIRAIYLSQLLLTVRPFVSEEACLGHRDVGGSEPTCRYCGSASALLHSIDAALGGLPAPAADSFTRTAVEQALETHRALGCVEVLGRVLYGCHCGWRSEPVFASTAAYTLWVMHVAAALDASGEQQP